MTEHRSRVEQPGQTIAAIVRGMLDVPWSRARRLCEEGRVLVDGVAARDSAARVGAGAEVVVRPHAPREPATDTATALPASCIVHVDGDVVVVDKPAGLSSVPFADDEHDTLVQRLAVALRRLDKRAGPPPRVVHRLDKETSGLLVFARTRAAERALAQQFRVHSVHRRYVALAHGEVGPCVLRSVLVADRGDGLRGTWRGRGRAPDGREAITHVTPLRSHAAAARGGEQVRVTWIACRLETGRTHQIRIHLSEAGHPIVGESVYIRDLADPGLQWPPDSEGRPMVRRQLLHAAELGFVHPGTDEEIRFAAPLPSDLQGWCSYLGTPALLPLASAPQAAATRRIDPAEPPSSPRSRAPRTRGRNNDR